MTLFSDKMHTWFDAQLDQKILDGIYACCLPYTYRVTHNIWLLTDLDNVQKKQIYGGDA